MSCTWLSAPWLDLQVNWARWLSVLVLDRLGLAAMGLWEPKFEPNGSSSKFWRLNIIEWLWLVTSGTSGGEQDSREAFKAPYSNRYMNPHLKSSRSSVEKLPVPGEVFLRPLYLSAFAMFCRCNLGVFRGRIGLGWSLSFSSVYLVCFSTLTHKSIRL